LLKAVQRAKRVPQPNAPNTQLVIKLPRVGFHNNAKKYLGTEAYIQAEEFKPGMGPPTEHAHLI